MNASGLKARRVASPITAHILEDMRAVVQSVLLIAAVLATSQTSRPSPKEMIGKPAPALVAEKWLNTEKGAPLSLEKLKGKVVVVDFWAYW